MAESVQNTDVEDVLSSIRRLVAETSSKAGSDTSESAEEIAAEIQIDAEKDALLLTSSQRVANHDAYILEAEAPDGGDMGAGDLSEDHVTDAKLEETADLGELRLALKRKAEEAQEEAGELSEEMADDDQPMFSKLPKSRLHLSDAMATSAATDGPAPLDPTDVFATHSDPVAEVESVEASAPSDEMPEPWNVAPPEDYYEDEVDADEAEADVWIVDAGDSGEDAATTAQIYDFDADREQELADESAVAEDFSMVEMTAEEAEVERSSPWHSVDEAEDIAAEADVFEADLAEAETAGDDVAEIVEAADDAVEDDAAEPQDDSSDLVIVRPETIAENDTPETLSEDEAITAESDAVQVGAQTAEQDVVISDLGLSEDKIAELVRDIVRQELTGEMGTLITKNLRQLVRREINRVLATKEFD